MQRRTAEQRVIPHGLVQTSTPGRKKGADAEKKQADAKP
jgi:hypothetical protein